MVKKKRDSEAKKIFDDAIPTYRETVEKTNKILEILAQDAKRGLDMSEYDVKSLVGVCYRSLVLGYPKEEQILILNELREYAYALEIYGYKTGIDNLMYNHEPEVSIKKIEKVKGIPKKIFSWMTKYPGITALGISFLAMGIHSAWNYYGEDIFEELPKILKDFPNIKLDGYIWSETENVETAEIEIISETRNEDGSYHAVGYVNDYSASGSSTKGDITMNILNDLKASDTVYSNTINHPEIEGHFESYAGDPSDPQIVDIIVTEGGDKADAQITPGYTYRINVLNEYEKENVSEHVLQGFLRNVMYSTGIGFGIGLLSKISGHIRKKK